jgi:hypothetical protein
MSEFDSWFDDAEVDIDDVPDNPNELPNNTYLFEVVQAKHSPTKNNASKEGITFKYQIVQGPWSSFFPITDWSETPVKGVTPKDKAQLMLSYVKMRLLAFGYSVDEIRSVANPNNIGQCVGRKFYGTTKVTKNKDGQTQIRVVKFDPFDGGVNSDDPWDVEL